MNQNAIQKQRAQTEEFSYREDIVLVYGWWSETETVLEIEVEVKWKERNK